jgi:hypothetical protein
MPWSAAPVRKVRGRFSEILCDGRLIGRDTVDMAPNPAYAAGFLFEVQPLKQAVGE